MKKLYKLCLCTLAFIGTEYSYAQKISSPYSLGGTKNFINQISQTISSSGAKQKSKTPVTKLQVSESSSLDIKVHYNKMTGLGDLSIMGEVIGANQGSFVIIQKGNKLEGNIILKKAKRAYQYASDNKGNATIQEVDIDGVVCIDMEHGASNAAVINNPVSAQIGTAVLNLQSYPGAAGCVLLDFDGYNMPAGNYWNNGNPINAAPSGMSDADIQEHWEVVSEDYRPFNMNITTSESVFNSYPKNRRMRCVVTPTNTAAPGAGGVAYISSFNWDNEVPCWVFITSGKSGGEASSHEIGHTLGLGHDGRNNPAEGYFAGQGDWSPIMGVGYYKPITQWSKGEYNSANNQEDDLAIMAGANFGVGYRTDDFGNSTGSAANLSYDANGNVSSNQNKGIIERTNDLDFFSFTTGGGNITLSVNTVNRHGDLDILVKLFTAAGAQIGTFNPAGLNSTVTASLGAGKYYISVDGTGAANPATDGYSEYASLGSYFISGNIPPASTVNENAVMTAFKDCPFGGYAIGLEEGDYTRSQLIARGISDNDISSLKVNYGFKVIVYQDDNFQGTSIVLNADDDCLVDNGFNDNITSLKVRPDGVISVAGNFHIQNRNSSLYMDVWGNSTADGAQILQGGFNGNSNQQFEFTHLGDGVYKIVAKNSGKSFDISGISKADGATLIQWNYVGGKNQQFILKDVGAGFYKLVARHSSKIIEVGGASTANGASINQWPNHGGTNAQWKIVPVTVTPPPAFTNLIQAENFSAMLGVQNEATTDAGGGQNVGYIDNADWMAYNTINFPTTGAYLIEYRVASVNGGKLSLDFNAGTIQLGAVNIPATGGWQNWTTVSHTVNVTAGTYNLGIFAQTGGWNINWIRITRVSAAKNVIAMQTEDMQSNAASINGFAGIAKVDLYPNPVESELMLHPNFDLLGAQLKIYNASGNTLIEESFTTSTINVNDLIPGIYTLVVITKDNTKIVQRFSKR